MRAHIGLFRSEVLNEQGQQIIKAVIVGDALPEKLYDELEAFLSAPDTHTAVLPDGITVGWLG